MQENPFKKLVPEETPPEELKSKVMASVGIARFLVELAELFTGRYVEALANIFKTKTGKK